MIAIASRSLYALQVCGQVVHLHTYISIQPPFACISVRGFQVQLPGLWQNLSGGFENGAVVKVDGVYHMFTTAWASGVYSHDIVVHFSSPNKYNWTFQGQIAGCHWQNSSAGGEPMPRASAEGHQAHQQTLLTRNEKQHNRAHSERISKSAHGNNASDAMSDHRRSVSSHDRGDRSRGTSGHTNRGHRERVATQGSSSDRNADARVSSTDAGVPLWYDPVAPMPFFNPEENRWEMFHIWCISHSVRWSPNCTCVRRASTKLGNVGIYGPWVELDAVITPEPGAQPWEGTTLDSISTSRTERTSAHPPPMSDHINHLVNT